MRDIKHLLRVLAVSVFAGAFPSWLVLISLGPGIDFHRVFIPAVLVSAVIFRLFWSVPWENMDFFLISLPILSMFMFLIFITFYISIFNYFFH